MALFYYSDETELYEPVWLKQPRGFVNVPLQQTEFLESMISQIPRLLVQDWSRHDDVWIFEVDEIEMQISGKFRAGEVQVSASGSMPRRYLDTLRAELRSLVSSEEGRTKSMSFFDFAVFLLQAIEAACSWTLTWKPSYADNPPCNGWEASGTSGYDSLLSNNYGVDLSTIKDVALHLLHRPIADICGGLPSYLRVLHVEPVFRNNLVSQFLTRRQEMEHSLRALPFSALRSVVPPTSVPYSSRESSRDGLASYLAKPSITFHGAPRNIIESIVRHGFLLPGTAIPTPKKKTDPTLISVANGNTYGSGIYSSPDPVFASHYMTDAGVDSNASHFTSPSSIPGFRLILCATLLGRQRSVVSADTRGTTEVLGGSGGGFNSHVSQNKLQCIVFNTAQIIPVYVLHLDYGAEAARKAFARLPADPREFIRAKLKAEKKEAREDEDSAMPGYLRAQKEAKKAAALKWFPYGFGSARGTRFVIEEIGEVDDDEEVYGEWQAERGEKSGEMRGRESRMAAGGSWFDQYQMVRKER